MSRTKTEEYIMDENLLNPYVLSRRIVELLIENEGISVEDWRNIYLEKLFNETKIVCLNLLDELD